jgi:UDP-N-acetylglucosamine 2-epimerase (non-hydrolysing)
MSADDGHRSSSGEAEHPVAHVETGLRSCDMTMPEEINWLMTDRLSSPLFTRHANLISESVTRDRIKLVGNVMIDTLLRLLPVADGERELRAFALQNRAGPRPFALVTLHRPSIVDEPDMLRPLFDALDGIAQQVPVVFPVHPCTRERMRRFGIDGGRGSGRTR